MQVMQINLEEPSLPHSSVSANTSTSNYESNSTISLSNGRTNTMASSNLRQEPQTIPAKSKLFNFYN
jgi:hypothetical protein